MGTRSIIVVTGQDLHEKNKTVRLYKHSDGYPTGNLPIIEKALENAQQNMYAPGYGQDQTARINVSTMVGLLIGAATSEYGMGAYVDDFDDEKATYDKPFDVKHLGNQCDLEWIYVINLDKKTVEIYGGGYTGKSPQHMYAKGTVDPVKYADELREEYKVEERQRIRQAMQKIEAWSFIINPDGPKPKKKRKTKAEKQREEFEKQLKTLKELATKQGIEVSMQDNVIQLRGGQ